MKIVAFLIALVFFVGGMVLFGYAFGPDVQHGLVFFAGIICIAFSIVLPVHVLKRLDR